jgi:hypothetical protein
MPKKKRSNGFNFLGLRIRNGKRLRSGARRGASAAKAGASATKRGFGAATAFTKAQRAKRRKQAGLNVALKREPVPVQAFARRAIQKGTPAKKAIQRGNILFRNDRLTNKGTLKRK